MRAKELILFLALVVFPLSETTIFLTTYVSIPLLFVFAITIGRVRLTPAQGYYFLAPLLFFPLGLFVNAGLSIQRLQDFLLIFLGIVIIGNFDNRTISKFFEWKFIVAFVFVMVVIIDKNGMDFTQRIQSGEYSIFNSNYFGYFGCIAICSTKLNDRKYYDTTTLIIFFSSVLINVILASRAGILFSFGSYLVLYGGGIPLRIKLLVGCLVLLILGEYWEDLVIVDRFMQAASSGGDSRLDLLILGLHAFIRNPLGYGTGLSSYVIGESYYGDLASSHNTFLTLLLEFGLLGSAIVFFGLLKMYLSTLNKSRAYSVSFILVLLYGVFYEVLYDFYIMLFLFTLSSKNGVYDIEVNAKNTGYNRL